MLQLQRIINEEINRNTKKRNSRLLKLKRELSVGVRQRGEKVELALE